MPFARGRRMAIALVLVAIAFYEVSAAMAVKLFAEVGPLGMVTYRNVFGALALLIVIRPNRRTMTSRAWFWSIGLGLSLAVMNSLFYLALNRIGLGATVTLEAIGPLVLSVAIARTGRAWLWAGLAMVGVVALQRGGFEHLDLAGFGLALGAGAAWAGYIVTTRRVGQELTGLGGLAVAMTIAGLCVAPLGLATAGTQLFHPKILLLGALVAIASSSIPYGMEMIALRSLPTAVFSVMMTLAPAAAALSGLVFLSQTLSIVQISGIAAVMIASAGAVLTTTSPPPRPAQSERGKAH